jgi:hypothetical protein
MRKGISLILALVSSSLLLIPVASAASSHSIIVITPPWPMTQSTPATFGISTTPASDPTYDPHILLVMTSACYDGLTSVEVAWTGGSMSLQKADFSLLTGNPPPKIPSDAISDVQYTRSSLADHLGLSGDSDVYWAIAPFLGGNLLHTTAQTFTVTLDSTSPRMLVYALGKAAASDTEFNRWVPPTNPGFVVPELAPVLLALSSFAALALYAVKRRKTIP